MSDPEEAKKLLETQLCCGCHDNYRGRLPSNLPDDRYLCPDCVESITCYVCNRNQKDHLYRCDSCGWRGAHVSCLGWKTKSQETWHCFVCAQGEDARAAQMVALPTLDPRVHEDYLNHITQRRGKKRAAQIDLEDQVLLDAADTGVPVLGTPPLKRYAASPRLARALAVASGQKRVFDPEPSCGGCGVTVAGLNFCGECGVLTSLGAVQVDAVAASLPEQPAYLAPRSRGPLAPLLPDGRRLLARLRNPAGSLLGLLASPSGDAVEWVLLQPAK